MNIYYEGFVHHKNKSAISLLREEGINFFSDTASLDSIKPDIVNMFDKIIDVRTIRNLESYEGPVVFGPHKFLFEKAGIYQHDPDSHVSRRLFSGLHPKEKPYYFNCLSSWLKKLSNNICGPKLNAICLPFPVDINRFQPKKKTGRPVVYFKNRHPRILNDVLKKLGHRFVIFNYGAGAGYNEEDFLSAISEAPYCIWIGCHESQGFAFQETLSCNTPIYVINVRSLREETGSFWAEKNCVPGHDLPATSASYFDSACGLISYPEDWQKRFGLFLQNLKHYEPRDFIVSHLSAKACKKRWENII